MKCSLKSGSMIPPTLFFFLKLLWLFRVFCVSIQILEFVLVLWSVSYSFLSTSIFPLWLDLFLFYPFWCNYKWDCFLNCSDSLLLVYRNMTFLYINLYPATLLNSFISSSYLVMSRISICNIMSSANSDSFIYSFPIWIPFISFFFVWLLWLGLPILCWIKVARIGILVLFLILEEMLSAFHAWVRYWL